MYELLNERYKLISKFQSGAQAESWLAEDIETSQNVVLKKISIFTAKNWKVIELFEREQKVIKNLDHPSIPKYVEHFHIEENNGVSLYLVQEYIKGRSLYELLDEGKYFTDDQIFKIIEELSEILNYLHNLNPPVIHRDIKPSNIIWGDDDKIYLIDFGAIQKSAFNNGSTVVGTGGYMAPEQIMSKAKPASDIYSVGATIIEILTHTQPSELPVKNMKIDYVEYINKSDNYIYFLDKMVEPDIDKRFQSGDEVLIELNNLKNGKTVDHYNDQKTDYRSEEEIENYFYQNSSQKNIKKKPPTLLLVMMFIPFIIIPFFIFTLFFKQVEPPQIEIITPSSVIEPHADLTPTIDNKDFERFDIKGVDE